MSFINFKKNKLFLIIFFCLLSSGFYDLILIDAGHKAKEVLVDLALSWELLRDGGMLIVDDYTWYPTHLNHQNFLLNSPRLGVDSFINCFSDELIIASNQPLLQLYIKKESPNEITNKGFHCFSLATKNLPTVFHQVIDLY